MNNLKRTFYLLPNGHFISFLGASYFCGRYRIGDRLPHTVEVELQFPFDHLFVSFFEGELRINHELTHYRFYTGSVPLTIDCLGGHADKYVGKFQSLESLTIVNDELLANGVFVDRVHSFPAQRFELNSTDLSRSNMFIGMGFIKVRFLYSWYRKVFFVGLGVDWFTLYLRVAYRLEIDND